MKTRRRLRSRGFTFVEVMVVLGLLALLTSVLVGLTNGLWSPGWSVQAAQATLARLLAQARTQAWLEQAEVRVIAGAGLDWVSLVQPVGESGSAWRSPGPRWRLPEGVQLAPPEAPAEGPAAWRSSALKRTEAGMLVDGDPFAGYYLAFSAQGRTSAGTLLLAPRRRSAQGDGALDFPRSRGLRLRTFGSVTAIEPANEGGDG